MYSAQGPKTYSQRKISNPAAKVATAADLKIQPQRSQCNKHLDFLIITFTIFPHYHTSKSDLGVCRDQVKDGPSLMTHGSLLVLHYLPAVSERQGLQKIYGFYCKTVKFYEKKIPSYYLWNLFSPAIGKRALCSPKLSCIGRQLLPHLLLTAGCLIHLYYLRLFSLKLDI